MKTCHTPQGWSKKKYKLFKSDDGSESSSESESESESDSEKDEKNEDKTTIRGYSKTEKYKKILIEEELLPE